MGILKQEEEAARRREQDKQKSKHNSGHSHNKSKGHSGAKPQIPLVKSFVTSYKFLLLVAEDGVVAGALALVMYGAFRVAGIDKITLPTEFGVLWALMLGIFLVQTLIWKR